MVGAKWFVFLGGASCLSRVDRMLGRLRQKEPTKLVPIKVGAQLPAVDVEDVQPGEGEVILSLPVSTDELFGPGSGKAILFGLPGAFTPTCSDVHVPGFVRLRSKFERAGVRTIACTSENDRFVLSAWNTTMEGCAGVPNTNVKFLADADAALATALGLREDMGFGIGVRTSRFALVLDDGIVTHVATDPGMNVCNATSAEKILEFIDPDLAKASSLASVSPAVAGGLFAALLAAAAAVTLSPSILPTTTTTTTTTIPVNAVRGGAGASKGAPPKEVMKSIPSLGDMKDALRGLSYAPTK
ncbi:hypothetical protein CTAYLR_009161 [Chrysophaeum taylorii]|uniref:Thioredoxin domain-containing protein n=1 Tax=Chrysophaeum taylorii TaxID=2483200 RepID=A0AAD7UJV6_9STRA|nr:hypothetical protein CTAYLR_009161 [Chrysophaeum taylorii]